MKRKRETIGIFMAGVALAIVAFVGVSIWTYSYAYRFKTFRADFAEDVVASQVVGGIVAQSGGVTTRLTERNGDRIYRAITNAEHRGYAKTAPEGEGIALDFGNGDSLCIWPQAEGGLTVGYTRADEKPLYVLYNETTRFDELQKLVSEEWGNEVESAE